LVIETSLHYDARSEKHQSTFNVFASKHFTFPYKYAIIDFIYYFYQEKCCISHEFIILVYSLQSVCDLFPCVLHYYENTKSI